MSYIQHLNATARQSLSSFSTTEVSPKTKKKEWFPPPSNKVSLTRPERGGLEPYFVCEECNQRLKLNDMCNYKLSPLYAHRLATEHKFDDPSRTICVHCGAMGEAHPIER